MSKAINKVYKVIEVKTGEEHTFTNKRDALNKFNLTRKEFDTILRKQNSGHYLIELIKLEDKVLGDIVKKRHKQVQPAKARFKMPLCHEHGFCWVISPERVEKWKREHNYVNKNNANIKTKKKTSDQW